MVWNNRIQSRRTHITWCAPCCRTKTYPTKKNILKPPQKQTQPNCKPTKKNITPYRNQKNIPNPTRQCSLDLNLYHLPNHPKNHPKSFRKLHSLSFPWSSRATMGTSSAATRSCHKKLAALLYHLGEGFLHPTLGLTLEDHPTYTPGRLAAGTCHHGGLVQIIFLTTNGWFVGSSR